MSGRKIPNIERLKREAKKLCRSGEAASHTEALESLAKHEGHGSWRDLMVFVERNTSVPKVPEQIVRFSLDDKDTYSFSDERLEWVDIARDEDFDVERQWEEERILRFVDWRSSDPREIADRVSDVFFFPPDRVWIGDRELTRDEWRLINPKNPEVASFERRVDVSLRLKTASEALANLARAAPHSKDSRAGLRSLAGRTLHPLHLLIADLQQESRQLPALTEPLKPFHLKLKKALGEGYGFDFLDQPETTLQEADELELLASCRLEAATLVSDVMPMIHSAIARLEKAE